MQPAQVGGRATADYILGLHIVAGDLSYELITYPISSNIAVQCDIETREKT